MATYSRSISTRFVFSILAAVLCAAVPADTANASSFGQAAVDLSAGLGVDFVAGDFDGDGHLDLATAKIDGTISIQLGEGTGTFAAATIVSGVPDLQGIATADLDGDGDLDLAVSATGTDVGVLFGNGNGTFQAIATYPVSPGSQAIAIADFTGDSKRDIALGNVAENTVSVLPGNGNGTFQAGIVTPSVVGPYHLATGDLNADGKVDLAASGNTLYVLLGQGAGTFLAPTSYGSVAEPTSVAIGDLNQDGKLDVVAGECCTSSTLIASYLGVGDGTLRAPLFSRSGGSPYSVNLGDFDADGKLDAVTADIGTSGIGVLPGLGNGTFGPSFFYNPLSRAGRLLLGDFDGNAKLDIAGLSTEVGLYVMLNTTGTNIPQVRTPGPMTVRANVAASDTGAPGARVTFGNPAVAGGCRISVVSCDPPSGSFFTVGTTTVTCNFTDACGTIVNGSFPVTVEPPTGPVSPESLASSTALVLSSQPGDPVGQGQTYVLAPPSAIVAPTPSGPSGIPLVNFIYGFARSTTDSFSFSFETFNLGTDFGLTPGYYPNARRAGFNCAFPGLDVSGNGVGCGTSTGRFQVLEAEYDFSTPNAPLRRLAIRFEQHCEGSEPALFGALYFNSTLPPTVRGVETIGVAFHATGTRFLRDANSAGDAGLAFTFGAAGASVVHLAGDWDNNWTDTPGIYEPTSSAFFLSNANAPGSADLVFSYGVSSVGIVPLVGDWNGDGVDTVGIYNALTGAYFLRNSNTPGPADLAFVFGAGGGIPIVGDWNGDGVETIGLYVSATGTFFLRNSNSNGVADAAFQYGPTNLTPIVGDWDGDGKTTVGLYVPTTGAWFLKNANAPGNADVVFTFGAPGATPLAGDWDAR